MCLNVLIRTIKYSKAHTHTHTHNTHHYFLQSSLRPSPQHSWRVENSVARHFKQAGRQWLHTHSSFSPQSPPLCSMLKLLWQRKHHACSSSSELSSSSLDTGAWSSMSASAFVWDRVIMMVLLSLVWGVGKWPCEMASSGFLFKKTTTASALVWDRAIMMVLLSLVWCVGKWFFLKNNNSTQ